MKRYDSRTAKIRMILLSKGMTMKTLSKQVNMSYQRVRSLACGADKTPNARKKIEAALNASIWSETEA